MRIAIADTETTGLPPGAKIVEFAAVVLEGTEIVRTVEQLINPGVPIPAEASAVHHLTDADVRDAMPIEEFDSFYADFISDLDAIGFHNAAFDKQFVPSSGKPIFCTLKAARKFVTAKSYSNQNLRYALNLQPQLPSHLAPHRALYDALVTAELYKHLITNVGVTIEEMISCATQPIIYETINFGKHAGKKFTELPSTYLQWLLTLQGKDDDFYASVKKAISSK